MTYRIKIVMGLVMLAVFVFLLIRIPVWNFPTGRVSAQDAIAGEWVGMMQITGNNLEVVLGPTPGPHRRAAVKFMLSQSDGFMDFYAGMGEMFILGEDHSRPIEIGRFRRDPDGLITITTEKSPSLPLKFNGTLSREGIMKWTSYHEGYGFTAELHKGTDSDYRRLLGTRP